MECGSQNDASTSMTPSWITEGSKTLTAIFSKQTEILECVANAAGSTNMNVRLPTIKLPRFDEKIED